MSDKHNEEFIMAWQIREGDKILMPDNVTWCTVEDIRREPDTGRLLLGLVEGGFSRMDPHKYKIVHRIRSACVYCSKVPQGNHTIHLSEEAMSEGERPEVPLCDACGSGEAPSCEMIWTRLRHQGVPERSTRGTPSR